MIIYNFALSGTEKINNYTVGLLSSEDGHDWYEAQSLFDASKLKIEFDKKGVISRFSFDVSMLWPDGKSVADIDSNLVPDGFNDNGEWLFDGNKILPVPTDYVAEAKSIRTACMTIANGAIAPLQDAVDLSMATEAEAMLLMEWKKYRVLLNRVDPTKAPGIEWPLVPATS